MSPVAVLRSVLIPPVLAAWLGLASLPGVCQEPGGPADFRIPPIPVDTFTLENGLHVMVSEDHSAPLVAVNMTYRVGSAHEPPGRHGFAHLFEHLLQQETENLGPAEAARRLSATGGIQSARTTVDRTVFAEVVPVNALELALWIHGERLGRLTITDADFEYAREVVLEEWRRQVAARPYARAALAVETVDPAWAPYGHPVIGSVEDLGAATAEDARDFYRRMYTPANATLAVVGDVTPRDVRELVAEHLGGIEAGEPVPSLPGPPSMPRSRRGAVETVRDSLAPQPLVYLAFGVPPAGHPDEAALRVLFQLLADEATGLLHRRMVAEEGVAVAITASMDPRVGPGRMILGALAVPGVGLGALQQALEMVLQELVANGPDPDEVRTARRRLVVGGLEPRSRVEGRADILQRTRLHYGSTDQVNRGLQAIRNVTGDDVQAVAGRYLTRGNRTVVVAIPSAPSGAAGGGS